MQENDQENLSMVNIDRIINQLLKVRNKPTENIQIDEREIISLCLQAGKVLLQQPMLLDVECPLNVCGDIHGQYDDLLRVFDMGSYPPDCNYLFLGDYVDRGTQSVETICLLLAYKVKYPFSVFLLRGNHECEQLNIIYGFLDECKQKYSIKLFDIFSHCFDCLPVAAIIGRKIFCCHGGLSPDLISLEQIRDIHRPVKVPNEGILCDLLWADPDINTERWSQNPRGISYNFGIKVVNDFLEKFDLDSVVRAHQVVQNGYEFFGDGKLVTIFTAPRYCGMFENAGAFMKVNADLSCSFETLF